MSDLGSGDLPFIQTTANNNSLRAHRHFLWETAINLIALAVAAGAGAISWSHNGFDAAAIIVAAWIFLGKLAPGANCSVGEVVVYRLSYIVVDSRGDRL